MYSVADIGCYISDSLAISSLPCDAKVSESALWCLEVLAL